MMMEEARRSGRWNKKAPYGTILLLMCMFIPTLTLQPSEEQKCPHGDYLTEKGICCNKCSPGFKLVEMCKAAGQRSNCVPCLAGQYTDEMNYHPNCRRCKRCKALKHEVEISKCETYKNTICRCEEGYFKFIIDSDTSECHRCTQCGPDEKAKQTCTPEKNTVCECKENYYRVNGKCVPCKNCTAECKHHCLSVPSLNTTAEPFLSALKSENRWLINIIAGGVTVAVVLSVLVFFITFMTTKRLLEPSSEPSDDSLLVMIQKEEPLQKSLEVVPHISVSEQEPSNLPDCVPLEIKIPDLIYSVLELVPVLQVKQLVRSLGVTDTVIERAEMDHRSCQEAHYQMLRVWTERGSQAGGGGRGGMLHRPLFLELLDKLRNMHLGQAAEELETKYDIQ